MPFAVTHILFAIFAVEMFRKFVIKNNSAFPRYYLIAGAIAGIIPDFDIGVYYVLYFFGFTFDQVHHTYLHSIFIPLAFLIIGFSLYKTGIKIPELGKRKIKLSILFLIFGLGSLLHLFLDMTTSALAPLYPFVKTEIGFRLLDIFPQDLALWTIYPVVDGAFLLLWIFWMQFKLKITEYF